MAIIKTKFDRGVEGATNIVDSGTEGTKVATGTTAQRGSTAGQIRFNTTTGLAEYYDGNNFKAIDAPPVVSSINPTNLGESGLGSSSNIVISGSGFSNTVTVSIIGNDGTVINPTSTTRDSATQITIATPTSGITNANEPYDIKVENNSGLAGTLSNALNVNATPTFTTASGSLGTLSDQDRSASNLTAIVFSDSESTATVSVTSGSLPTGITLNSNGTFSGTANSVSSNTTSNFTVTATDGTESATRDFSITVNSPPVISSITGSILTGASSNLTINVTQTDGTADVIFKEGATTLATLSNQTISNNAVTVAVPSAVYSESAGDTISITVNDDGSISNSVDKTIISLPTGGTITTHGSYRVHTFTSSGNFVIASGFSKQMDTLLVAGGGAGGNWHAGGGGAGGMFTYQSTPSAGTHAVVVGGGGAGGTSSVGSSGGDTTVFSQTAVGGGRGGNYNSTPPASGGSGGGGNGDTNSAMYTGASGTSGQGNDGGNGNGHHAGGGGGGKGASGSNAGSNTSAGNGGSGGTNDYRTGSNVTYAGGGGGGVWSGSAKGNGGSGGGGNGSFNQNSSAPTAGTTNTGGGGGGSGSQGNNTSYASQTTGGSGIVVIRYTV